MSTFSCKAITDVDDDVKNINLVCEIGEKLDCLTYKLKFHCSDIILIFFAEISYTCTCKKKRTLSDIIHFCSIKLMFLSKYISSKH